MTTPTNVPPLDVDLSSVDTSFPLLVDGIYDLRCDKAEIKDTADHKGRLAELQLVTVAPATGRKGEALEPGATRIFERIMLAPTGKATWDMVLRNMGSVVQAVQGGMPMRCTPQTADQWVPMLQGRTFRCRVGYEPAGTKNGKSFNEKNVVTQWVKA